MKRNKFTYIAVFFLSLILNIVNHKNVVVAILNTLFLYTSIYYYLKFSNKKFSSYKFTSIILLATMPLILKNTNPLIILLGIGTNLLLLFYLTTKYKKILLLVLLVYLLFTSFYAGGLIKLPFSLQNSLFIFKDNWTIYYIDQMRAESLYVPYRLRLLIFNSSVYLYVLFSKVVGLLTLKNFYDAFLLANIYPFIKGLISFFRKWDSSKSLMTLAVFVILFGSCMSRSIDTTNTYILLFPFLLFFIIRGLGSLNKKIYYVLYILSLVIALSP